MPLKLKIVPCSGCSTSIAFIKTPAGKKMPVDPVLITAFTSAHLPADADERLVTEDGRVVRVVRDLKAIPPGRDATVVKGFVPHWATCPESASFKKGKSDGNG